MEDVTVNSNIENLELYSDSYPFRLSLRTSNFENESEYKKFVRNCEMMIRRSVEYKLWRNYIVDVLQVNECAVTHESMEDVTIEVHHHLPSLYSLTCALVNRCIDNNTEFCTFDICQEAIELHFKNKVGYVALLKSMHEKFHNGKLTIPISFIKGDYNYFVREFSKFLDDDEIDKIQTRLATNESNCTWSKDEYPIAVHGGM
jgi:hypothetical protein